MLWARQHGDELVLIGACSLLCAAYFFAGKPEVGLRTGVESVERARRLGDDVVLGASLMMYLLSSDMVEPGLSGALFAEAIACTERSGDVFVASLLENNAAVRCLRSGDIAGARAHLDQAALAAESLGDRSHHLSVNRGWVLRAEGDPAGAREGLAAALRLSRRNGDQDGLGYATLALACLAADAGNWEVAGELHGAADMFIDRAGGEPWQQPEASYRLESIDQVRNRLGEEQFDHAYAAGRAFSFDEAFNLALGTGRSS